MKSEPGRNIELYEERFKKSKALFDDALKVIPAGVNSTARARWSGWDPFPIFVQRGTGSKVTDVDGNEFIDYLLGLGPMFFGHRPKVVTDAVIEHISNVGTVFSLASELDITVAKKIIGCVPGLEKVRLNNSGTEAVIYALRLARAYTGRKKIIRFEGMYHGFADTIYWSKHPSDAAIMPDGSFKPEPQGPGMSERFGEDLIILGWNDKQALEQAFVKHSGEIAGVITEPIMCNTGCILPEPGYLELMRELCTKNHSVLIFDEVITGFRVALSGAQGKLGIVPDLSIFAKGMGGGFPIAAIGGKKEIMGLVDTPKFSIAGTYSGNGIALAAASATLDELQKPGVYEELYKKSDRLRQGIARALEEAALKAHVVGMGPVFQVWFADRPIRDYRDAIRYASADIFTLWWEELLFKGVMFHPHYLENLFVSLAHTEDDIDITIEKAREAAFAVRKKIG